MRSDHAFKMKSQDHSVSARSWMQTSLFCRFPLYLDVCRCTVTRVIHSINRCLSHICLPLCIRISLSKYLKLIYCYGCGYTIIYKNWYHFLKFKIIYSWRTAYLYIHPVHDARFSGIILLSAWANYEPVLRGFTMY